MSAKRADSTTRTHCKACIVVPVDTMMLDSGTLAVQNCNAAVDSETDTAEAVERPTEVQIKPKATLPVHLQSLGRRFCDVDFRSFRGPLEENETCDSKEERRASGSQKWKEYFGLQNQCHGEKGSDLVNVNIAEIYGGVELRC